MSAETIATATVVLPAKPLAYAMAAVMAHRAPEKDGLPQLAALHFIAKDNTLKLEATDRYTIGEAVMQWDGPDIDVMLPPATADALLKIAKTEARRRPTSGTPYVALRFESRAVTIDTPDAVQTLPTGDADTLGAFPRTSTLWPEESAGLGDGIPVGVTPRHFAKLDKATTHPSNAFRLAFNGPTKPIVATPASDWTPEGVMFRALIMPVRLAS